MTMLFQVRVSRRREEPMPRQVDQDDVGSILDYFQELDDPRCHINRKHLLGDLLVICVLAVIAEKVIDGEGDFVLALKGNQETLHNHVRNYIVTHMENDFADVTDIRARNPT